MNLGSERNTILQPDQKELLAKVLRFKSHRCLEPMETCSKKGIRAHSIPNRAVLTLLEKNGHVVVPRIRGEITNPRISFESVGRNQATTFTGLCATHDNSIFSPIESQSIDYGDPWQLFLLSYRAIIRQLHADIESALKVKLIQSKGDMRRRRKPESGIEQLQIVMVYDMYRYKKRFDDCYLREDINDFCFEHFTLLNVAPTVAVNSPIPATLPGEQVTRHPPLLLNVVPQKSETHIVLAALKQSQSYLSRIANFLRNTSKAQFARLTQLIVRACENFVISAQFFEDLSDIDRSSLQEAFVATMREPETDLESLPSLFKKK